MSESKLCYLCGSKFKYIKTLYAHLRKIHDIEPDTEGTVKCPKRECSFSCNVLASLRVHVQKEHKVEMVKKKITFKSWDSFLRWKSEEEERTKSSFVQRGGRRHFQGGTKLVYLCHRTGKFTSRSEGKRVLKSLGSYKMGSHCTAAVELSLYENGTCTAVYFKTHFGHKKPVSVLRICRADREAIAVKILDGVPFETIVAEARASARAGLAGDRLRLLSRKDLHNIARNFGIAGTGALLSLPHDCHEEGGPPGDSSMAVEEMETAVEEEASAILSRGAKENAEQESAAAQTKRLKAKIQALINRVNSAKLSAETLSSLVKYVDRCLSLTNSDLSRDSCGKVRPGECDVHPSGIFRILTVSGKSNVTDGALRRHDSEMSAEDVSFDHSYCKS